VLVYVDWFDHRRLLGTMTDRPGHTTFAAHDAARTVRPLHNPRAGHPKSRAITEPGVLHLSAPSLRRPAPQGEALGAHS
jgi:hypothetical protein